MDEKKSDGYDGEGVIRFTHFEYNVANKKYRGHILEGVIGMEQLLNHIFVHYFCTNESAMKNFSELILHKEFFNLHKKILLFRDLKLHKVEELKTEFDRLSGKMLTANKIRNDIAHLKENNERQMIIKLNGKKEIVNEDFINRFDQLMGEIRKGLIKIILHYKFSNK
jgi:hypothetical protein